MVATGDDLNGSISTTVYSLEAQLSLSCMSKGLLESVGCILAPLGVRISFQPTTTLRQLLEKPKDLVLWTNKQVLCIRSHVLVALQPM